FSRDWSSDVCSSDIKFLTIYILIKIIESVFYEQPSFFVDNNARILIHEIQPMPLVFQRREITGLRLVASKMEQNRSRLVRNTYFLLGRITVFTHQKERFVFQLL